VASTAKDFRDWHGAAEFRLATDVGNNVLEAAPELRIGVVDRELSRFAQLATINVLRTVVLVTAAQVLAELALVKDDGL